MTTGADDNFQLQSGSPAIDAADPNAVFVLEPAPNGGRMNLGNYGNTPQADPSPAGSFVQVTSPGSQKKFEAGKQYTINWRTDGVTATQPAWLIDVPSSNGFDTSKSDPTTATKPRQPPAVDLTGVTNWLPAAVYQSYASALNVGLV